MRKYRGADLIALTFTPVDDLGVAIAVTEPATATVYDGAGTQVDTGDAAVTGGVLSYALVGAKASALDTYKVMWECVVGADTRQFDDVFELVGASIVTVADIRGYDRAFEDVTKYPDAYVSGCRDQIEEQVEQNGMCAFRPRGAREKVSGSGQRKLVLRNTDIRGIYSITVDGVALTADELAALAFDGNAIYRELPWPRGFANIAVHYSYGFDRAPGPIRRAALILAKEHIVPSTTLPARATASTIGEMQYRITIAGRDGFTGIPDVDAAINQFGRVRPVVG
jgi:hypothetical protein